MSAFGDDPDDPAALLHDALWWLAHARELKREDQAADARASALDCLQRLVAGMSEAGARNAKAFPRVSHVRGAYVVRHAEWPFARKPRGEG